MELGLVVRRALQQRPRDEAVIFGARRWTFAQFAERVMRLAAGLKALGVGADDRVAILALNSDRYLEYYQAVPWAGAICVPVNIRWAVPEIVYSLDDAGATVLFVDDAFAAQVPAIRAAARTLRLVVHCGDGPTPDGLVPYESLIADHAPAADAGRGGDDLAGIFYTGGTTGFPKGVMLSHHNLMMNGLATAAEFGFTSASRYLHAAPMFHAADGAMSTATLAVCGTHVIIPSFSPRAVMASVSAERVNAVLLVPTMLKMTLDDPQFDPQSLRSLERYLYGASPMPEALLTRALAALPWVQFIQAYGQTELSPCCTVLESRHHVPGGAKLRAAGRAMLHCEIRICDAEDREVPRGTVGQVLCRGDNVMRGYWNKPDATAEALKGGWMHTGDAAWMDDDGYIYVVDRVKDMIISGGENVYSAEVENALMQFPGVGECAVIGVPDERWGERVHAIIVPRAGHTVDPEAVMAHCRQLIAGYKCPRSVEVRQEPLPLSGAGKILKTVLREPHWQGQTRNVS